VDSLRRAFLRPDTTGRSALMAEIERNLPRPEGVVIAPEGVAPRLAIDPEAEKVELQGGAPVTPVLLPETRGVEGIPPPTSAPTDSVGLDSTRYDSTRAVRARSASMDWLTGRNLEVRPLSRPAPLPPRRSTAANRTRPDSASPRALAPDSLGRSSATPSDPNFLPIEAESAPPQETPAEPAKLTSRAITSFQKLTKEERAQLRVTQRREKAVRDSVREVKKAQKNAEKAAEKTAKEAKKHPPAPAPAPTPTLPDTAATGKAQRDSLSRIVAPPAIPARPDTAQRDTSGSRH
jgi:hypothetical protein